MHFTYQESCDAVGYSRDPKVRLNAPQLEYEYVGYINGVVVKCSTIQEYDKFKLREKVPTEKSKKSVEEFEATQNELQSAAAEHFETKLREYFSELSPAQFNVCWDKAWGDNHSEGYDSVACKLEDYVEFCQEFVLAEGKE
jgi:hypothetical protein